MNWEEMKDHIIIRMMPESDYEKFFKGAVHKTICDMAAVYYLEQSADGRSYIFPITYAMCGNYGITIPMLNEACEKQHPLRIENFNSVLGFLPREEIAPMWCISNETHRYGAGVIAYPGAFEKIAEELGGSYYLLPSSIHENLAVRDDGDCRAEELNETIRSINGTQLEPDEVLQDHCYYYNQETKELTDPREER